MKTLVVCFMCYRKWSRTTIRLRIPAGCFLVALSLGASLAPRIHHRLPCDIRHRYSRYRPGDLHRPGGRCGPGYGSDAELAAGYLVDDVSDAYQGSYNTTRGAISLWQKRSQTASFQMPTRVVRSHQPLHLKHISLKIVSKTKHLFRERPTPPYWSCPGACFHWSIVCVLCRDVLLRRQRH